MGGCNFEYIDVRLRALGRKIAALRPLQRQPALACSAMKPCHASGLEGGRELAFGQIEMLRRQDTRLSLFSGRFETGFIIILRLRQAFARRFCRQRAQTNQHIRPEIIEQGLKTIMAGTTN